MYFVYMRSVPKLITTATLVVGLAIWSSSAQAVVAVEPALELLEEIPIVEETSMETYEPEAWVPDADEEEGYYSVSGCSAAQEILIRATRPNSQKVDDDDCTLLVGAATDPYSGDFIEYEWQEGTDEAPFAIGHVVSAAEAHRSSASSDWPDGRKLTFYHD